MSSNVIHQAPSARRQASPSKRTTGNTSHSCFAVSLVAAAIALAACPAMAAGMVTAGSGAGVAVGATSSTPEANQVAVGPNARTDSTYSGNAGEASIANRRQRQDHHRSRQKRRSCRIHGSLVLSLSYWELWRGRYRDR